VWTAEKVARLQKMWADGVPAAAIGRALGVTDRSVASKVCRLRLPPRPSPILPRHGERDERIREAARRGVPLAQIAAEAGISTDRAQRIVHRQPAPEPVEECKPLRTLGACTWVCCHAPAVRPGWCAEHAGRVSG